MSIRLSSLVHIEVGPPLELKELGKRVDADLDSRAEDAGLAEVKCEGDGRGPEVACR